MTSTIVTNNVDTTFPIAGQDNDSQGFRTNFTNIQNNFVTAASEITTLQNTSVFKGNASIINNMGNAVIQNATFLSCNKSFFDQGNQAGPTATLNFATADFQKITATGNITLAFAGWPASGVSAKLGLLVNLLNTKTLTFPASVVLGANAATGLGVVGNIASVQSRIGTTLTPLVTGDYMFEFTTVNGGTAIYVQEQIHP